jgi:hypothetical protein
MTYSYYVYYNRRFYEQCVDITIAYYEHFGSGSIEFKSTNDRFIAKFPIKNGKIASKLVDMLQDGFMTIEQIEEFING